MHQLTKPVSLLFSFLVFSICFILGGFYAQYTATGVNEGLAGEGRILFNGLLFGFIGLFLSLFIAIKTSPRTIGAANRFLVLIFTILLGILLYQYLTLEEPDPVEEVPQPVTAPAA